MRWKMEIRGEGPVFQNADFKLMEFIKLLKSEGQTVELATIETPSQVGQVEPPAVCPYCGKGFVPSWLYGRHVRVECSKRPPTEKEKKLVAVSLI